VNMWIDRLCNLLYSIKPFVFANYAIVNVLGFVYNGQLLVYHSLFQADGSKLN
jgi:hypothetical protein